MTVAVTLESRLLERLCRDLDESVARLAPNGSTAARLDILEGLAAAIGGVPLADLRDLLPRTDRLALEQVKGAAGRLVAGLAEVPMAAPLAIASLAQPALTAVDRRRVGAFYTDFRLAEYVAAMLTPRLPASGIVLDPACGSGILLAAVVDRLRAEGVPATRALDRVAAADLSEDALRSCAITLAAFTSEANAVGRLTTRLVLGDSLTAGDEIWEKLSPEGIAAVVTNPPWEKLKLSRHELLKHAGYDRHYGARYTGEEFLAISVADERSRMREYTAALGAQYVYQGTGENDLYKLFIELAYRLVSQGGEVSLIVPAGLIRSRGATALRAHLFAQSKSLSMTVLENRARFFSIDTRFKFLILRSTVGHGHSSPVRLRHAGGISTRVEERSRVDIPRHELAQLRADLTVPEVRDAAEWSLFARMSRGGCRLDGSGPQWRMHIDREIDMTNDSALFETKPSTASAPLIEGRMVHQFRYGAKAYESGTGRRASWRVVPLGAAVTRPQFWVPLDRLPARVRARMQRLRLGFCDVTGQTNERSMLASIIPPGVVCGNKVPTILLDVPPRREWDAFALWLAIANSFAFDWLLRRVVTTSVNFFVLRSLAFPPVWIDNAAGRRLAALARCVLELDRAGANVDPGALATYRATIDAEVAAAWSLSPDDVDLVLADFPLLDRGQPPIPGEQRSTVTADLFGLAYAERVGTGQSSYARRLRERLAAARELGAIAYQPSEHTYHGRQRA